MGYSVSQIFPYESQKKNTQETVIQGQQVNLAQ